MPHRKNRKTVMKIATQVSPELRAILERKAFEEDTTMSWIANEFVMAHFGMTANDFKHARLPKTHNERNRNKELYGRRAGKKEDQDDFEGHEFLM